jgi:cytochrome c-type biogenesis protein CcmH/NrfG
MGQIWGFMSVRVFILLPIAVAGLLGQDSLQTKDLARTELQGPLAQAADLYRRADYRASLTLLRESGQSSGKAHFLTGQDHYMLGDYNKAAEAFERAFLMEPANSDYALWLGRSLGRRAETSLPWLAPKYAAKARAYFEKAVALDPNNREALSDLFDYYLEAPGFLGGGYDKAEAIAARIAERDPAAGRLAQAKLADRRKQFDTLDEQVAWAIHATPREVGRVLDVARHLARLGRIEESEAAFDRAERLTPNSPEVRLARARTYIEQKRNLDGAKALLNEYLRGNSRPGDPLREQAEKLLLEAALLLEASGA